MCVLKIFFTCLFLNSCKGIVLPSNPSIVIVGSGPAGIAAATRLLKNNFTNIKVFEAENRIGGRINSVKFGDAYVDLGAEFCHGEKDSIVYSLAKDLGVFRDSHLKFNFLLSNGEIIEKKVADKILKFATSLEAENTVDNDCGNVTSVGECLTIRSNKLLTNAEDPKEKKILQGTSDWAKTYLSTLDSAYNLNNLSILSEYKKCEGNLALNWNGHGYKTILEIMMQKFPNPENQLPIDEKIFLQKQVNFIARWQEGGKVLLTTTDVTIYQVDHVIFTPSVGVLKHEHDHLFSPALPEEKIDAIKSIGYDAVMKVLMHFPERWWQEDASWPFIWTAEDKEKLKEKNLEWLITITGITQAANNPKVLTAWYAGSHIPLMETLSDEQILEGQKHIIQTFLAPHFNVTMPDKIIRSSWLSNPRFLGTFSYETVKGYATGENRNQDKLAKPLLNIDDIPTVLFAGEATHPHYFSTVHGAIETGYREADRLIELYKGHNNVTSSNSTV